MAMKVPWPPLNQISKRHLKLGVGVCVEAATPFYFIVKKKGKSDYCKVILTIN